MQHRVKGGVEAAGPDLGLEPLAEGRHQRYAQFVLQFVQHALDVLADDPGDAGGSDEDGVGLVAFIGLEDRVPQLFRGAEDCVPLLQIGADDLDVAVFQPPQARPGLVVDVARHRIGRTAHRRMVDHQRVRDAAELVLAAARRAGAGLGEAAFPVLCAAGGGLPVQVADGADIAGDGLQPVLPDRHLVPFDVYDAHTPSVRSVRPQTKKDRMRWYAAGLLLTGEPDNQL